MLGVSKSLVAQTEIETKGLSKNTIDKLKELFPNYSDDIDRAILEDKAERIVNMAKVLPDEMVKTFITEYGGLANMLLPMTTI